MISVPLWTDLPEEDLSWEEFELSLESDWEEEDEEEEDEDPEDDPEDWDSSEARPTPKVRRTVLVRELERSKVMLMFL